MSDVYYKVTKLVDKNKADRFEVLDSTRKYHGNYSLFNVVEYYLNYHYNELQLIRISLYFRSK